MTSWWVVRVLLDESVPRQLARFLSGHEVSSVPSEGWAGLSNGRLLRRAAEHFDAFVTGDQSLQYQQPTGSLDLGIVVLALRDNRVETVVAMAGRVLDALTDLEPGQVVRLVGS